MRAILALADGRVFPGVSFGAIGEGMGEVVFNTSMTGYQEILTDPSYRGQIVVMTYPEIGNVGINPEDLESTHPHLSGFVVREYWESPSNWRSTGSLDRYLKEHQIVGIQGVDTRSLVRHIRDSGAQEGIISTLTEDPEELVAKATDSPGLVGRDLVKEVTCEEAYEWDQGTWERGRGYKRRDGAGFFVVAYDFGIKFNILRNLVASGCRVRVVPAWTPAEEVLGLEPDGVFLSNGPGDPDAVPYARDIVRNLIGEKPIFGICLGHQILGLALGGRTYKLKFGHHGGNQPVMDLTTRKVEITTQNHGFAVDAESLNGAAEVTHLNLNDHTVEGLAHRELPIFSVQYHPESSPGPHDASYLFKRFVDMIKKHKG
jgi:carbamoyl-phosphate synthase small subunit